MHSLISNRKFFQEYHNPICTELITHFSYRTQVKIFVDGLFTLNNDLPKFKLNLRDFLIQLKEFSAGDNTELFAEDREIAAEETRRAEREKAMKVGGLMKPSEMDDVEL